MFSRGLKAKPHGGDKHIRQVTFPCSMETKQNHTEPNLEKSVDWAAIRPLVRANESSYWKITLFAIWEYFLQLGGR